MKKMTHGGGVPVVLSVIALVLALVASFQEYLLRFIYNMAFDAETEKVFVESVIGYFEMNRNGVQVISLFTEKAFILAIIALIAVVIFASSGKKKTIVSGQGIMLIGTAAACLIEPVIYLINFFGSDMKDGFSSDNDGERFRCFYGLLIYALPALISILLIVAGLVILCRIGAEKNKVEVARKPGKAVTAAAAPVAAVAAPVIAAVPQEAQQMQEAAYPTDFFQQASPVKEEVQQKADETVGIFEEKAQQVEETVGIFEEKAQQVEEAAEQTVEPVIEEAVPQQVFCPNCGQQLSANAKFCNNCGAKR